MFYILYIEWIVLNELFAYNLVQYNMLCINLSGNGVNNNDFKVGFYFLFIFLQVIQIYEFVIILNRRKLKQSFLIKSC